MSEYQNKCREFDEESIKVLAKSIFDLCVTTQWPGGLKTESITLKSGGASADYLYAKLCTRQHAEAQMENDLPPGHNVALFRNALGRLAAVGLTEAGEVVAVRLPEVQA